VCVCVCESERERERETVRLNEKVKGNEWGRKTPDF
jgi:hypothetical protein